MPARVDMHARQISELAMLIGKEMSDFQRSRRAAVGLAADFLGTEVIRAIGQTFHRGTGKFAESIGVAVLGKGESLEGHVYIKKLGYYGIHETGGVIKPKRFSAAQKTRRSNKGLSPRTEHEFLRFVAGGHWVSKREVVIPKRETFGPTAERGADRAAEIIGEAFRPFIEGKAAA